LKKSRPNVGCLQRKKAIPVERNVQGKGGEVAGIGKQERKKEILMQRQRKKGTNLKRSREIRGGALLQRADSKCKRTSACIRRRKRVVRRLSIQEKKRKNLTEIVKRVSGKLGRGEKKRTKEGGDSMVKGNDRGGVVPVQ